MAIVKVIDLPVNGDAFQAIYNEHGEGEIQPRLDYTECTEEAFPDHKIIRGLRDDGTFTGTGFLHLAMDPGELPGPVHIIAGVDQIPREAVTEN